MNNFVITKITDKELFNVGICKTLKGNNVFLKQEIFVPNKVMIF